MKRSIGQLIAANRRASALLTVLMIVLLAGVGALAALPFALTGWWIGALAGVFVALAVGIAGWLRGSVWILKAAQAFPASDLEGRAFHNVISEVALAAGIESPRAYIIEDASPNAFAAMLPDGSAAVVATRGLLGGLDRDELQAVVAHEIAHIRNRDVRYLTMVAFIAGIVPLLAHVLREALVNGFVDLLGDGIAFLFGASIAMTALYLISPILTLVLKVAVSHRREYLADATAVELTRHPAALCRAISKVCKHPGRSMFQKATEHLCFAGDGGTGERALSSHPSPRSRINALRRLMGMEPTVHWGENASSI